jgi:hypothetical protein
MNKAMDEQLSKMSGQELFRYAAKFDDREFELLPSEISTLTNALTELGKKQLVPGSSLQLGSVSVSRSRDRQCVTVHLSRRKLRLTTGSLNSSGKEDFLVMTFAATAGTCQGT